jgi:hypothetical protein
MAVIRSYAIQHNFVVVETYTDEGRSGLARGMKRKASG